MKPKQITWNLNRDGTGYSTEKKDIRNDFEIELENPTTQESDSPFETHLTDSGIPWSGPKIEEKALANIIGLENPKLAIEEPDDQKIDELKTFRAMQETLTSKLKIEKIIEKKCQTYISSLKHSGFTREELVREKKADLEMRRRLQILLEKSKPEKKENEPKMNSETRKRLEILLEKFKPEKQIENESKMNISSLVKCRFTKEELAREKKVDLETRKRLQAFLEKIKTKKEKDIATLFDPVQGEEYYLNRYKSEPAFKAWFDTNFQDYSIEQVLDLAIPVTFSKSKPDLHYKNSDLQKYIDIYNNEPMYKDWFDRKYPGQSIYDIIGIPEPQ